MYNRHNQAEVDTIFMDMQGSLEQATCGGGPCHTIKIHTTRSNGQSTQYIRESFRGVVSTPLIMGLRAVRLPKGAGPNSFTHPPAVLTAAQIS